MQFALVPCVLLDCCHSRTFPLESRARQPGHGKQLPGGFIEFPGIPHDIHVSHAVTLPRVDRPPVSQDRSSHTIFLTRTLEPTRRPVRTKRPSCSWKVFLSELARS